MRAGRDGLKVTFEDPDAPEPAVAPRRPRRRCGRWRAKAGRARPARGGVRGRVARASRPRWQAKAALLARMGEPGFWEDEGRVAVLAGIELRDRIEAGLRSAGRC